VLIETTDLGLAEIAFAAGFGSVRQFNDTMRQTYGRPPSDLRRGPTTAGPGTIALRLPFRAPLHGQALIEFFATRAIAGVDEVIDDVYQRGLRLPHGPGQASLAVHDGYVEARLQLADMRDLAPAVARCRRLFDLDADPVAVDAVLAADPALLAAVAKEPGVRVPGAVDGFEMAVRAVVGQQISVAGARTVIARLVAAATTTPGFPTAEEVAEAPDEAFSMPAARRRSIQAVAAAVAEGRLCLDPGADRDETVARLLEIGGIGPWTAQYVTMRALGDPDVLMTTDLGVRRGAAAAGLPSDAATLEDHAARYWAPWRSYANVRLWRQP
jgi:AraC family transcriptional regulator of adaptative response / DNA-3-methyladenine glycosylase II